MTIDPANDAGASAPSATSADTTTDTPVRPRKKVDALFWDADSAMVTAVVDGDPVAQFGRGNLILGTPFTFIGGGVDYTSPITMLYDTDVGVFKGRWSANGKGPYDLTFKSRGAKVGDVGKAMVGDRVYSHAFLADHGDDKLDPPPGRPVAHVCDFLVLVDGDLPDPSKGREFLGRFDFKTYGGPERKVRTALAVNGYQKTFVSGPVTEVPRAGTDFPGILTIGAGYPTAGGAPIKFTLAAAALLDAPEVAAFEVAPDGVAFYLTTSVAGVPVRNQVLLAPAGACTAIPGSAAGSGANVAIVGGSGSGRITLTTGTGPSIGTLATIAYPHAFATDSFPTLTPGNEPAAHAGSNIFVTATASGFAIRGVVTPLMPATTCVWTFAYTGI